MVAKRQGAFLQHPDSRQDHGGQTTRSSGDSFHADKPRLWSPGQFTNRGNSVNFILHPDGKRFAVLKTGGADAAPPPVTKVNFIFNFFDELRAKAPAGKN